MSLELPHLIPLPRRVTMAEGHFDLATCPAVRVDPKAPDGVLRVARMLATRLATTPDNAPEVTRTSLARAGEISLRIAPAKSSATPRQQESYRLEVQSSGVRLTARGEAGLFYGAQTLLQLFNQAADGKVPALHIEDRPDFEVRGFYHDVSRGKVPTRATLFALVEQLAHYKVNQLQLYLEHTFAFARHADVWAGSDPLTADDILALDAHAAAHHVELVPSLSTFGHFYTALVSPRKHDLNELPIDASRLPFSWWDRMGHYTLDCRNPESLALVREMILELRPLFRSTFFNICCDETFDLGKGRNAAAAQAPGGVGRLYLDFLKQLMAVVREADATPMFWGDIVGNHPELVGEVPRRVIALDWDYSAELKDSKAELFRHAGLPYYICPGVCGWDRWVNDLDTATANIIGFARRGRRKGALGLLNTDWGDRGHINALGNSTHGLALGAAAAWNVATAPLAFDAAFAWRQWGDVSGLSVQLMREAGRLNIVSWRLLTLWLDPTPHRPEAWWDAQTGVPVDLLAIDPRRAFTAARRLDQIRARFERITVPEKAADPLAREEFLLGCRGQAAMNRLGAWIICLARGLPAPRHAPPPSDVADDIRRFERDFSAAWHARNRPSEYWRVRTTLLELARRLELAALRGVWIPRARIEAPPAAERSLGPCVSTPASP